jgi:hypothetical protein
MLIEDWYNATKRGRLIFGKYGVVAGGIVNDRKAA